MKVKYIAALTVLLIGSMMITPIFADSVPEIKVAKGQPQKCIAKPVNHVSGKQTMISGSFSGSTRTLMIIQDDDGNKLFVKNAGSIYGTGSFKNIKIPSDSKYIDFCIARSMSEPVRGSYTYQVHYK